MRPSGHELYVSAFGLPLDLQNSAKCHGHQKGVTQVQSCLIRPSVNTCWFGQVPVTWMYRMIRWLRNCQLWIWVKFMEFAKVCLSRSRGAWWYKSVKTDCVIHSIDTGPLFWTHVDQQLFWSSWSCISKVLVPIKKMDIGNTHLLY